MVKADLVSRATKATNLQGPVTRQAVEAVFESLSGALVRGDRVALRRFGAFRAAPRKTGVARNPRTGEPAPIPGGRVVRFRPAMGLFPGSR
ncbi:MAG: integration host factor subunit beta [Acidobacteria bacterium]|nr:integration host factor subunit beta [Acidobacteriota bacterium]